MLRILTLRSIGGDEEMIKYDELVAHAAKMRSLPDAPFCMRQYNSPCGTMHCSLGWALVWDGYHGWTMFDNYCFDKFGIHRKDEPNIWMWLFSSYWRSIDNTLEGACRRIDYLVEHKCIPDWFSSWFRSFSDRTQDDYQELIWND